MSEEKKESKKNSGVSGLGVPAGLLTGIGLGLMNGNMAAWVMLGLGAGFVLMIAIRLITREW